MTTVKRLTPAALATIVMILLASAATPVRAGSVIGVDVGNYIVLYEGGSSTAKLSINNFGTTGTWIGDIGVAGVGKFAATGPGTLNGNVDFAAANTGQATINNTTINGTVNYNVVGVQAAMSALNMLSSNLGAQVGSGTALTINTTSTQTVLASNGFLSGNNRLFTVSSINTNNGQNLIIKGDGSQNVVFNVNTLGSAQFHGNILLQDLSGKFLGDPGYSGLFPDQVLFNLHTGATLDINNNGNNAHPNNVIEATFLDPLGSVSMVNTRLDGRIFGGDCSNMQLVSGDTIRLPALGPAAAPEPSTAILALCGAMPLLLSLVRRRRNVAP